MARARNIKPGFFENELLAELGAFDRLLFLGLWTLADREGRLEDRPKRIKIKLFPGDDYDVERGLEALAGKGFISRYQVEGYAVVEVCNFLKHQKPHGTEKDSTLPDANGFLTVNERGKGCCVTGEKRLVHVNGALPIDGNNVNSPSNNALILRFTDSPNPEEEHPLPPQGGSKGKPAIRYPVEFEAFWAQYPKRDRAASKPDALKAWNARRKDGVPAQDLITAATNYRNDQVGKGKAGTEFVKLPSTFLGKGEHWKAYLQAAPAGPATGGSTLTNLPIHAPSTENPDGRF